MIIALHSYKGGTGKTLLSVNLGAILANRGYKICLLDLDFRAPSLHVVFKKSKSAYWMNDYLNRVCEIDNVLIDCSSSSVAKGEMFVGFADPSTEAIRRMASKDRKWELNALSRLLSLRDYLLKESHFDYVIFDTSPGLPYSSINAIVTTDVVFVVTTPDKSDLEGTKRMIPELYELFEKKTEVILNKVPVDFLPSESGMIEQIDFETMQLPIIGAIPCSCDLINAEGKYFFVSERPNHQFTRTLQEIASKILQYPRGRFTALPMIHKSLS